MGFGISGTSGYYHAPEDLTQVKTAQRATIDVTRINRFSAKLLESDNKYKKALGSVFQSFRKADLSLREKKNDISKKWKISRADNALANQLRNLPADADHIPLKDHHAIETQKINEHTDFKQLRVSLKREINESASSEQLKKLAEKANENWSTRLIEKKYRPIEGLSDTPLHEQAPMHMVGATGHRVRLFDEKAPVLARTVAKMTNKQYETGAAGISKTLLRAGRYGAVGLHNSILLAKQGAYSAAGAIAKDDSEESITFARRASRAKNMRQLNRSALTGNVALSSAFENISYASAYRKSEALSAKDYELAQSEAGVAPPKTSYTTRKWAPYFEGTEADGENPATKVKRKKIASAYMALRNIKPSISAMYYESKLNPKWSSSESIAGASNSDDARLARQYDALKKFNAIFSKDTRAASLRGNLTSELARLSAERQAILDEYAVGT